MGSLEGETPTMAYSVQSKKSGRTYYLHSRDQSLRGGHVQTIYFFGSQPKAGAIDAMPNGYRVAENPNTGLPFLKKG